jgi:hypothetical protein
MPINTRFNRRSFMQMTTTTLVGIAIATPALHAAAPASAVLPKLELDNPTAKALGYVEDTTKVDAKKYPNHNATQICSGCALIAGADKDGRVPCKLFPGRSVASKGWCASFAKKPAA